MRFNAHTDEEICGKRVVWRSYEAACLRIKGHAGPCVGPMNHAAAADGVEFCCRAPTGQPHASWCRRQSLALDRVTVMVGSRLIDACVKTEDGS